MLKLLVKESKDEISQENMRRIQKEINQDQPILKGNWKFVTLTFTGAVTNFKYPHKFKFIPHDVIQTSLTGAGALTWNYSLFDRTNINITTTGACVVRAFVGNYLEGGGQL